MNSKILISVNKDCQPVITIDRAIESEDVRDILVGRFVESGVFAAMFWEQEKLMLKTVPTAKLLELIYEWYQSGIPEESKEKFESTIVTLRSLILSNFPDHTV